MNAREFATRYLNVTLPRAEYELRMAIEAGVRLAIEQRVNPATIASALRAAAALLNRPPPGP